MYFILFVCVLVLCTKCNRNCTVQLVVMMMMMMHQMTGFFVRLFACTYLSFHFCTCLIHTHTSHRCGYQVRYSHITDKHHHHYYHINVCGAVRYCTHVKSCEICTIISHEMKIIQNCWHCRCSKMSFLQYTHFSNFFFIQHSLLHILFALHELCILAKFPITCIKRTRVQWPL